MFSLEILTYIAVKSMPSASDLFTTATQTNQKNMLNYHLFKFWGTLASSHTVQTLNNVKLRNFVHIVLQETSQLLRTDC